MEQIRTVSGSKDPALETRIHDPELGTIRLLVSGRAGDVVRAELFVTDQRTAEALARAVDRSSVGNGLAGIDLRIRTDAASLGAGGMGNRSGSDSGGRDAPASGWAGANGSDGGRGTTAGNDDAGRGRATPRSLPATSPISVITRRGPAGRSLDVRA